MLLQTSSIAPNYDRLRRPVHLPVGHLLFHKPHLRAFSALTWSRNGVPRCPDSVTLEFLRAPCVVVRPSPTRAANKTSSPRALFRTRNRLSRGSWKKIGACDILFSRQTGRFFFFAPELLCSPATGIKLRVTAGLSTAPRGPL